MAAYWVIALFVIAIVGCFVMLTIGKSKIWDTIPYWVLVIIGLLALIILIVPWILQPQDPEAFTNFF